MFTLLLFLLLSSSSTKANECPYLNHLNTHRERSTERETAIQETINKAQIQALLNGYILISTEKGHTFYGQYTKSLYSCGSKTLETYFEYERMQGTYDSTWYAFTYHVKATEPPEEQRKQPYKSNATYKECMSNSWLKGFTCGTSSEFYEAKAQFERCVNSSCSLPIEGNSLSAELNRNRCERACPNFKLFQEKK